MDNDEYASQFSPVMVNKSNLCAIENGQTALHDLVVHRNRDLLCRTGKDRKLENAVIITDRPIPIGLANFELLGHLVFSFRRAAVRPQHNSI